MIDSVCEKCGNKIEKTQKCCLRCGYMLNSNVNYQNEIIPDITVMSNTISSSNLAQNNTTYNKTHNTIIMILLVLISLIAWFYMFVLKDSVGGVIQLLFSNIFIALIVLSVFVIFCFITYYGKEKSYAEGFKRGFVFLFVLMFSINFLGAVLSKSPLFLARAFSLANIFDIAYMTFIQFNGYFIIKKIVWFIMSRLKTANNIVFFLTYTLTVIIFYPLYIILFNAILIFLKGIVSTIF